MIKYTEVFRSAYKLFMRKLHEIEFEYYTRKSSFQQLNEKFQYIINALSILNYF